MQEDIRISQYVAVASYVIQVPTLQSTFQCVYMQGSSPLWHEAVVKDDSILDKSKVDTK